MGDFGISLSVMGCISLINKCGSVGGHSIVTTEVIFRTCFDWCQNKATVTN